jgi:hypothetical protein
MQAAVTKEGLRMFPSAIGHPRVVPPEGAVISGELIPGGVRFDFFFLFPFTPFFPPIIMCWILLVDVFLAFCRRSLARVSCMCIDHHSFMSARRSFCPTGG